MRPGPQGEQRTPEGDAGAPGTQVLLGQGPPTENDVCQSDGDIYIDTDSTSSTSARTKPGRSWTQPP